MSSTIEELDMFVGHHCTDFGMAEQVILGDGCGGKPRELVEEAR